MQSLNLLQSQGSTQILHSRRCVTVLSVRSGSFANTFSAEMHLAAAAHGHGKNANLPQLQLHGEKKEYECLLTCAVIGICGVGCVHAIYGYPSTS